MKIFTTTEKFQKYFGIQGDVENLKQRLFSKIRKTASQSVITSYSIHYTKLYETRRRFNVPVAAYSVSGEYALVKGAAKQGWINENDITSEILYSIKRAGADMIVTYFAKSAAKFLQES